MTMGERIRQAREEAGLSQRELAGDVMTRNMLSALEHDGANPSVGTLRYLADKLCKPVGYFFGEAAVGAEDLERMARGREAFGRGDYDGCLGYLEGIAPEFETEGAFLKALALLNQAKRMTEQGRLPFAKVLLEQSRAVAENTPYFSCIEREWILAMARVEGGKVLGMLEGEDEALILRAKYCLEEGQTERAEALLDAAENRDAQWQLLRGEVFYRREEYEAAAECYHRAEKEYPAQSIKRLEICYREMDNYKMAYYYAKLARNEEQ